jgi:hypothetical protein
MCENIRYILHTLGFFKKITPIWSIFQPNCFMQCVPQLFNVKQKFKWSVPQFSDCTRWSRVGNLTNQMTSQFLSKLTNCACKTVHYGPLHANYRAKCMPTLGKYKYVYVHVNIIKFSLQILTPSSKKCCKKTKYAFGLMSRNSKVHIKLEFYHQELKSQGQTTQSFLKYGHIIPKSHIIDNTCSIVMWCYEFDNGHRKALGKLAMFAQLMG